MCSLPETNGHFGNKHNARTVEPSKKPQQPHFPHPRRICLTDSLIQADSSDRQRRKAREMRYPMATREGRGIVLVMVGQF